ncbi:hypothetical protein [Mesorhizobium sp. M1295]|uniref:hypothetical protein n=1 Tax=Mesorhizobium sp. M1295 TaxID=2957076 RepID=UPI003339FC0D
MSNAQPQCISLFGRLLFALVLGAIAPCSAIAQTTLEQAKSDAVTIAIANEPPYAFMDTDGSPTGTGPELDKAILQEAGVTQFSGAVMEYGAMMVLSHCLASGRAENRAR